MIPVYCRYSLIVVILVSLLNLATIRKKEDPIAKTQTDPIAFNDKIEELKEGPKGAPTPSFQLYAKSKFFTELPVDQKQTKESKEEGKGKVTELGKLGEEEEFEEDWWMEEEETAFSNGLKELRPRTRSGIPD